METAGYGFSSNLEVDNQPFYMYYAQCSRVIFVMVLAIRGEQDVCDMCTYLSLPTITPQSHRFSKVAMFMSSMSFVSGSPS